MMATAPVKPQPLHNFPLSLKWGQTTALAPAANQHQHHHRSSSSSSRSPVAEFETESENEPATRPPVPTHPPRVGSRSARHHRMSFTSCATILPKAEKTSAEKQAAETVVFENNGKSQKQAVVLDSNNYGAQSEGEEEKRRKDEEEGGNLRPWKLRPRKRISKEPPAVQGNEHRERESNGYQVHQPKSMRLRGSAENGGGNGGAREELFEKKEKRKFWIALSREEIEEDIFIMTGSRPARRPKKRPKNVQRVLDNVFPGMWLVGTTADYYRLADTPVKR